MFIVIYGTAVDGFSFYGPFATHSDTGEWARKEMPCTESFDGTWEIGLLNRVDQCKTKNQQVLDAIMDIRDTMGK